LRISPKVILENGYGHVTETISAEVIFEKAYQLENYWIRDAKGYNLIAPVQQTTAEFRAYGIAVRSCIRISQRGSVLLMKKKSLSRRSPSDIVFVLTGFKKGYRISKIRLKFLPRVTEFGCFCLLEQNWINEKLVVDTDKSIKYTRLSKFGRG
jgi:hypothetical protein